MRVLYLTDTHLGIAATYRGAPEGWSRAQDHQRAFDTALDAVWQGPPVAAVVHSGDLFDRSHPPADAVEHAVEAFRRVARAVPVYIIPGNHDRHGLARHFASVTGVTVGDAAFTARVGDARIGFVPWHRDPDAWAGSARRLAATEGYDVLVAHQAFDGAQVPGYRFTARPGDETVGPRHIPSGVHTILCGHIHPRQSHAVGPATVHYPGSTERTAFSEREETKGYAELTFGRRIDVRFVDLPTRAMHEVHAEADVGHVRPGALVRLGRDARHPDIEAAVVARGGWVLPWSPPSRQLRMFG